jgi:hypothetical protein
MRKNAETLLNNIGGTRAMLRPFFFYYGGKNLTARNYGPPQRAHVIEPFAGGAGYSCYWQPQQVTLIECDETVVGVWHYLQRVSAEEILRLPIDINELSELPQGTCQEARDMIGFLFHAGDTRPSDHRRSWARSGQHQHKYWGELLRRRIARQVKHIRHWRIIHGSWEQAPDVEAHWYIDPPYSAPGSAYRYHDIDYPALAKWCKNRKGFVQVCEVAGADWLEFKPLHNKRGLDLGRYGRKGNNPRRQARNEVLFERGYRDLDLLQA